MGTHGSDDQFDIPMGEAPNRDRRRTSASTPPPVEELPKLQESKDPRVLKSSLRWNLKEDRKDDQHVTHAALKTIGAFLNTEGGDLLIGGGTRGVPCARRRPRTGLER